MNRGRFPGTARARRWSALARLCAASAVAWGLLAWPAPAQDPSDTAPSFGTTTVADQAYTETVDVGTVELPAATGGNGTLTYALARACASGDEETAQDCGLPSGLTFDADDRELTGTPDTAGTYAMEYTVTDADANTAGSDADTLNFTITVATAVPGPPGNLAAEASSNGVVKLTWDLPAHTGASKITRHEYRYEVYGVDPSPWIAMNNSAPGGTNATSYNLSGLLTNRVYFFFVRAVNGAGEGPESVRDSVLTKSPSGKNLVLSKEFTDNPVVAGHGVGARTVTLQFSVTNTHWTEDATDVKYTDNLVDMLPGATLSERGRAVRCTRYDGTDVSGVCEGTSSPNYRECGVRWGTTDQGEIRWAEGFTVPARSTCYATDVVNIPAGTATGSYENTSGAVTGKYGEKSVTGNTAKDTLRVRANDQSVRVEKWFSGGRNTGTLNEDNDTYNYGKLEFNYRITNPNPTLPARVSFIEDFSTFVEKFKGFTDADSKYTLFKYEGTGCSGPRVRLGEGREYGTFSFSTAAASPIPFDNGSCTFKVTLNIPRGGTGPDGKYVNASGTYTATTKLITTTRHGNDFPSTTDDVSASTTIIAGRASKPLEFTKAFGPPAVAGVGGTVDLTYTLTNQDGQRDATDITFVHDLTEFISGAVVTNVPVPPCGDDSAITLEIRNKRLRFRDGLLGTGKTCTFTVTIGIPAGTDPGTYASTTRRGSYNMGNAFVGSQAFVLPAISADVLVPAVPAAPGDFTAVRGDEQVTLGWTAPADTGGTDVEITGYEYSQDGGNSWTDTGATSTSHVVEALANGTEYPFRVRARNVSGAGAPTANLRAAPRPVLTISDAEVEEGNGDSTNMTFTVTQSATSTKPVKVEYETADPSDASLERATVGEDYDTVSDGTLTFAANTTGDALAKTVSVLVRGDTLQENDEYLAVVLHTPDGAHIQDSEGVGKITNDDQDTAPSFGTETVDDQTAVAHIAMADLVLPEATGGNGTLTYALACASGQTGCEGTPALPPGLSFDAATRTLSGTPKDTGTTTLTYTVTDADDITDADDTGTLSFDITVDANQPPTAVVGDDRTVAEGDTVTLDGSASTDPESQELTYTWTAPEGITLSDARVEQPTFDAPEVDGTDDYTFTLTVSDGVQDSVAASVTITVEDDTAPSFGTETVDDQTAVEHIAMADLELPAATAGNGTLTYALACASGQTGCEGTPALPPGLSFDAATRTLSGTPTATGTTRLTYAVTDADDNDSDTDTGTLSFDITVNANQVPTADAGAAQTVAEGDTVTLDGSGSSDPEEQTLTYWWTAPSGSGITLSSPTAAEPTFDAPEVDGKTDYIFTLVVNDGVQDSDGASVIITVEDDTAPSFGKEVDDQTAVAHIAMADLVLPEATGGNGTLTYALACASGQTGCEGTPALPPGLSFDVATRTLSGTPTVTGTTTLAYTVTDADDNTADTDAGTLSFDIAVGANQAPTADAGAAQTVAEGDIVTLDGSGSSDPEEQPLAYTWTALDGITLSDATAEQPTFTAPEVDGKTDYTFTLVVNDGVQDSDGASVIITVEDDTAPSFGAEVDDQTAVAHIAISELQLPEATGGNGTLTYALACASEATGCTGTPALPTGLSFDAATRTLSGIPTATGTTTLTYTVTDADDNTADTDTGTLSFDITVNANQVPTANAGVAQTVAEGDRVTLDGSASSDPEEQPLAYTWTALDGITLSDATAEQPTFTAPEVDGTADYTFTLVVNDGVQDSAAASVIITVEDDIAPSFGAETVDDQTAVAHIAMAGLELPEATAGNGTLTYALACASGQTGCEGTPALPPGLSFDAATRTLSGIPTDTGTTTLTYTVTDADDNTADTDTGTLSFNVAVGANQAPAADAGADRTVAEGDAVTLDGSGSSDPEGQTLTYAWTAPAGSGITLSSPTAAKPTFDAPEVDGTDDYTFTLVVNDGVQASAAASVTITVEDDTAPSFGTNVDDQTEVVHIAMEALDLPAATGGNGTLTYALACASGQSGCEGTPALPPGLSFDGSTRILSGTPTATGTTTLTYTVTDADDNTADTDAGTLSFDIAVGANQAPTADAGAAQTVAEGDRVTLDGSGSSDPEEQTLTYAWTTTSGVSLSSPTAAKPTFDAPEVDGEADYTFTLIVNDGVQASAAASVTITVTDDTAPSFGTVVDDEPEVAHIAMEALVLPEATGGNGDLSYALACAAGATECAGTPSLPPGLSFDAPTRTLSGTPTATGTTTLIYTVTDADDNSADTDTGTLSFNITVSANQVPTADAGPAQTVTEGDLVTLDGSGSTDPEGQTLTYAWTVPLGSGITLSSPTAAKPTFTAPEVDGEDDYTFTLIVNDGVQDSAAANVTITVKDDTAPSFGTETVDDQSEVVHIAMEDLELPAATGGNGTLTYALACASGQTGCEGTPMLPPGLSFDASTRTLSGTPTAIGTTRLTYTVTDADDNTADTDIGTLSFDIAVNTNQVPTADAGVDRTVAERDTVTLDGSGSSDPEGQALTYAWTAPLGSGITLSSTTAAQPTFAAPAVDGEADYTFTLTVNDGVQDSAAASVTITVKDDAAPSFGTETVDDQTEVVHIAMEALVLPVAMGGNGDLSYALACAAGATGCTGTPALPPGLSFDAPTRTLSGTPTATGTTRLTYTVTDADDNTNADDTGTLSFNIAVGANQAPTADAGAAQTVAEGDRVTLDGSGSSDPENQELTYTWTTLSGITLSSPTAAKPTFDAPAVGSDGAEYEFTLVVNDGVQNSAAASVTIAVKDNTAPSFGTETVDDQTAVAHIAMSDLQLPEATGGNGTLAYALACTSGQTGCEGTPALPPGLSFDAPTRTLSGTPTATGTTTLTYTVTDADDNIDADDTGTLTFDITVGANQAPTADAGAAQTVTEGDLVTLDGSGSTDPEGQTLTYAWTVPSGSGITLSSTTAAKPTFTAPTLSADTPYTFTLTVNDGAQDSAAASVTITVEDDTAPSFGTETVDDQTEVVHIAMADLELPVATGGNGTLTYALACAAGATGCSGTPALPPGLSFDAATRTLSGTPTATGTTTLTYTVTDADDNVTASDAATLTFEITVGANQVPTANAGAAQTVTEGDTVTLDGSGSADPEGQTLTYAWTVPSGSGITLSSTTAVKPTFTAPTLSADTPYTFTLTVNDGVQDSAAASVTITVEDDTAPSFGTETVDDQTEVEDIAMADLVLPVATGGNGTLTYTLACESGATGCSGTPALLSGLSFDASTRTLSGTPTATGTTTLTYTVTDADDNVTTSDAATLTFDITVGANQVPTADAGAAQTVTEGDAVTLDGSGSSDPEDQPLTYKWTAPAGITLSSPSAAKPAFTAPTLSADTPYTFTLTVNDGVQDSAAASVTITVEDDTVPSFGTETVDDQTEVVHIAMEDLELPAATGGNGTLTYELACAAGATGCSGTPALPPGLSFDVSTRTLSGTPTATGTTTLTYTVTDADDNVTASDAAKLSFDITVGANQAPTADAGAAQTVTEGDTVTLDGSGSTDPEGQTLTYAWTVPSGSGITLSSTTAAKPTFTAPTLSADTPYTFTLTVNDGAQDSAAASVTITVTDDTSPSFGMETVDDQTEVEDIAMADLVLPVATGGNGTLTYTLACASGATGCTGTPALPPGLSFDASTRTLSGTPTATGATTLTYTVTDADDNVTASDAAMLTFDITVGTNQAPTANAGSAQTVAEGDRVTLDGSGSSDPESQELTYAWTAPSGSGITLSSPSAAEPTFTAPSVSADTPYTFTLIVNDGVQDSAEASVTVTVKDDTAPSFGTETVDDQTEVVHIAMADLVLPVATGGNGALRYALTCASGATGCTGTPALPPGLSFAAADRELTGTPDTAGTYSMEYTATDADDNVTASDAATLTFGITVGANQAPTADAGAAQTVTEGDTVTLDGSGSSDPEEQPLTYTWTPPSAITLSSTTAAKPTFTAPTVNADTPYTFTLTVNDGVQDSAEASSVIVTVEDNAAPSFAAPTAPDQLYVKDKAISTLTLPELTLGNGVNADHDYAWAPELPDGLTLDSANPASLTVSGTPTVAPSADTYTLTVSDRDGDTATVSVNITVADDEEPSFAEAPLADQLYVTGKAISTLTLPELTLGNGANTDHDYAWAPVLPAGLTLDDADPASLSVSGTPTAASSQTTYTLTVTDVDGDTASVSVKITVEGAASPSFAEPTAPDQLYVKDFPITALNLPELTLGNGANADHDYKWAPALPAGLTPNHDDPASLTVSGTPTAASGQTTYTLTVSDRDGDTASVSVKITVEEDVVPRFAQWDAPDRLYLKDASITPLDLPELTLGNGDHTYVWDPALPTGLALDDDDPANLTVSGTPTEISPPTPYTLTVTDMNEDAVTLSVSIEVTDNQTRAVTTAALVVTKSQVAVPENGVAEFGLRLATAPTHDVTVALERSSEGDEDLRIREGASLTFTAATWETAQTVTLEAQDDADKVHGTATFLATSTSVDPNYDGRTVEVEATEVDDDAPRPPPPPVPVALPLAFAGSVNDLVYTEGKEIPGLVLPRANGGTAPFAYELAPLPSGLVFDGDPARRRLAGTPDRPGLTPLRYTVTDATGDTATLAFHIVVEEDLAPLFDPGMVADLKPQNYIAGNAVHLRLPVLTLGNGTNEDHSYEWSGKDGQTLALPVGLSLEGGPASLAVTGTPTEHTVSTEYALTVTDRDGDATSLTLHIAVLEITEKPPGSEVTFDEATGEIMLRNVRFALEDGPERTWDAARIKLPAGHMVNGLALRVANLAADEAMPPDPGTLFGGVALVISPTGGLAGGPASVCLSTDGLPQGKAPRLYHENSASGVWKRVDTEMRGEVGLVCGDVSSFSRFRAGYEAESLVQVRERALEHMLAAFGRTVATDAVSVLSGRMVDVSQGGTGSRFTLAGRTPGSRGTVPGHDGMTIRTGSDRATAARNDGDWLGTGRGEPDLWADRAGSVTAISDRELLTGTSFQLALGEEDGGAGGHATLWGKGRTAGFRGISAEGFALDGDVVSGWLGIDWRRSDLLLGLALSHSQGEMDYEDLDAINRDFSAQVEADLTGVYPYARLSLDDGLDVWGIAGVGAGGLTLADGFGGNETDIDMGMAAAGARRALGSWSLRDIDFAVKGDALSVMMRSDPRGLASPDSGDDLPEVNVSAQRVRLALEGGHTRTLESGGLVQSTLELGARYDRGGAETGAGVDLAGAVRYEDLSRGLTVEGRGRLLLAHEAEGFEEWGVGGTIRLSPGASGLGYSFSMEPSWGAAASGADRLWNDRVTTGADTAAGRRRLAAEFGYGLGVFSGQGVLTPHVAASLTDGEGQDYRVGARLRLGLDLRVDVGVHHLEGGDGEAEMGIGLQLSSGF